MRLAAEYLKYAKDCREAAEGLKKGEGREQLLEVAAQWEKMAAEREARFNLLLQAA